MPAGRRRSRCPICPTTALWCRVLRSGSRRAVDFTVTLRVQDAAWTLRPTARSDCDRAGSDPRATTHIDYFHCRANLAAPQLTVTVATPSEPDQYLLTLGSREFHRTTDAGYRDDAAPRRAGDQPTDRPTQHPAPDLFAGEPRDGAALPRRRRIARHGRRATVFIRHHRCTACGRSRSAPRPTRGSSPLSSVSPTSMRPRRYSTPACRSSPASVSRQARCPVRHWPRPTDIWW